MASSAFMEFKMDEERMYDQLKHSKIFAYFVPKEI